MSRAARSGSPLPRVGRALLLGAICVVACARPPVPVDVLPSGERLPLHDVRVRATLESHRLQSTARRGLRGTARVAVDGPDFQLNRPQRIAVERPARLRFEILALFDQVAAILATDGEHFDFYDASTGGIERGRVTPTLLWDLTKIDLDPEELVGLLLAAPEPEPGMHPAGAWLEPSGRLAIAFAWSDEADDRTCWSASNENAASSRVCRRVDERLRDDGGQLFFFDPAGRLVELRAFEPRGVLRFRARFEEHVLLSAAGALGAVSEAGAGVGAGVIFPKRVTLESPNIGAEAHFVWKRVLLADELSDRLFRLPAPRGASGEG